MDGETSPLLSGTPTPTLHDSDSDSYTSRDPRASFSWLIPVAVMATLCNALTTSSRHAFFREFVCEEMGGLPSTPDPSLLQIDGQLHFTAFSRLDCSSPPFLSGLVSINLASMIATCVLSALSTGWWSRFGDIYGRRYALMISVLGSILLNLIFTAVAGSPSLEGLAQPCIFIGLLLEGLLGGSATFHGAIHAYTADVSPAGSWSTIFSILQAIVLSCTVFGSWIGLGVDFVKPFLSFGLSAAIGFINLGFIFFFLPESLPEEFEFDEPMKVNFKDVKKSIYSTVTILTAGHRLAFFGLAFFLYSLTVLNHSNCSSFYAGIIHRPRHFRFQASFLVTFSLIAKMATLFILFPAMLYLLKRRSPLSLATSTRQYFMSVMSIDGSAVRYSVFADFVSQLIIIVIPSSRSAMFLLLALMTPLTVGIKPALYALSAVYSEILGGAPRRGALFGAMSVVGLVGETLSYITYVSTYNVFWGSIPKAGFIFTAALLSLVAVFVWPSEERIPRGGTERIRIVVTEDAVIQDPSTLSPVYRRHGTSEPRDRIQQQS
ncbi:hypothetical protein C8R43DRAFT_1149928 [Mycena crocata]|nr:hypothetical protein C8R43DRAFT_1149928 [Mycena crocata]